jgi:Zn-dependent metalloprotease
VTEHRIVNCITPPYLLDRLLGSADAAIREAAMNTLITTSRLRGERAVRASLLAAAPAQGRRTVSDCKHRTSLSSAVVARTEDGSAAADISVNRAFDGFGATRQFYLEVLGRNSIDGKGMRLDGYVHRGVRYNNAFWDGREMVFGDGDGKIFTDFTSSLDVIGHELTHGVTEHTAGLEYHNQSGALNESMSDVMGSLVKQWSRRQTVTDADWLIGPEVFTPDIEADALRSLKAPGHAYDNEVFGKDPQPDHMSHYVELPDTDESDNGGVHLNSGIPNKAFYLTAAEMGGYAWEAAGHIWYEALRASTGNTDFQEFAETAYARAGQLYGSASAAQQAVGKAWDGVGITVGAARTAAPAGNDVGGGSDWDERFAVLSAQIEDVAREVHALNGTRG